MIVRQRTTSLGGIALAAALAVGMLGAEGRAKSPAVEFKESPGQVEITIGGKPFATYYYEDAATTRPYFAHVHAPGDVQVTRNHPPVEGKDLADHGTYHPGIWMAFGDINGSDFWRMGAPVKHAGFLEKPTGGPGHGSFAVRNSYRDQKHPDEEVCSEDCRFDVRVVPEGYLVLWDATFSADKEFTFGDQEEMGLGIRMATPLRAEASTKGGLVAGSGEIHDSEGRRNEKEVWGNSAEWCDYVGVMDGKRLGIALLCHPENFRPSWFHARNYGLLEANPFGRASFGKGEPSEVTVKPGEKLRLRYGVLIHGNPESEPVDMAAAFREYVKLAGK